MALQPGDTLGAYYVTSELGRGGMATVYKAHHNRLDRDVAIKIMHAAFQADTDFMVRFEREAKIVARLDHPHIVPVYDFAERDGQPYLVMKYIEGQTLKQLMDDHPPALDEIVRLTDTIAGALSYAHQQGVLHRDVKPSNVIIAPDGTPYLTDFGLARVVQTGESTLSAGMIVGTPNYVSPEQAEGQRELTEQSDVYSLGVMLYQMVVGQLPFNAKTPYSTIHMHIYEPPPLPSEINPEIPTEVEMVLLRALEKAPDNRYPTPPALAEAFKTAVERSGLTALSDDRSGLWQGTEDNATPSTQPPRKPKREENFNSALLLLENEESWANLPREQIAQRRLRKRREERIGLVGHAIPYVLVNVMIIVSAFNDGQGVGGFIPALGWGAGLAAHALSVYFGERGPVAGLYSGFDNTMRERYGTGWRETVPEAAIYREWQTAQEQFEAYKGAVVHSAVYVLINSLIWLTWLIALGEEGAFVFPYPLIVMAAWGIGLIGNWLEVRGNNPTAANDETVMAEVDLISGYASPPRKRDHRLADTSTPDVRLDEDGEFTDSMVDEMNQRSRN